MKAVYDLIKDVYQGDAVIPLNRCNAKAPEKLPAGNPICGAGLDMHKDGKTSESPKPIPVPVITETGTMAKKERHRVEFCVSEILLYGNWQRINVAESWLDSLVTNRPKGGISHRPDQQTKWKAG